MQVVGNVEAVGPLEASLNVGNTGGAALKAIGADGAQQIDANSANSANSGSGSPFRLHALDFGKSAKLFWPNICAGLYVLQLRPSKLRVISRLRPRRYDHFRV